MKIFLVSLLFSSLSFAEINVPQLTRPVMDETHELDAETIKRMEDKITAVHNNKLGPQLQVLIVNTLDGYPIEDVAEKVFNTWKLGDKTRDDGVLFLVAIKDRKMRIEVGYGLEGSLTDYQSRQVTSNTVKPYFKREQYAAGIEAGVSEILNIITQEAAVQTASPVQETPAREMTEAEKQQMQSVVLGILGAALSLTILVVISRRASKAYSARLNELYQSQEHKAGAISSWDKLTKKHSIVDADLFVKELELSTQNYIQDFNTLDEQIKKEQFKQRNSPKAKLDAIMVKVEDAESEVNWAKREVEEYKQIVKQGY